jgi:hypothetical protein
MSSWAWCCFCRTSRRMLRENSFSSFHVYRGSFDKCTAAQCSTRILPLVISALASAADCHQILAFLSAGELISALRCAAQQYGDAPRIVSGVLLGSALSGQNVEVSTKWMRGTQVHKSTHTINKSYKHTYKLLRLQIIVSRFCSQ